MELVPKPYPWFTSNPGIVSTTSLKVSLLARHVGHRQLLGKSSNDVPGFIIPPMRKLSPFSGSYCQSQLEHLCTPVLLFMNTSCARNSSVFLCFSICNLVAASIGSSSSSISATGADDDSSVSLMRNNILFVCMGC